MRKLSSSVGVVLLACGLAACGASSGTSADAASFDGGPDAAIAPPCPLDGGVNHGDYAECGGGCTILHEQGVCSPGYICTCAGVCTWWAVFPTDAGPSGCGFPDASPPDASALRAR
jgi:hypothetical protein